MSRLLGFMEQLVEAHGGVVERELGSARAQALMPERLSKELGLSSAMVSLVATDDLTGSTGGAMDSAENTEITRDREGGAESEPSEGELPVVPVGYGTELLERAVGLASRGGRTAAVCMPPKNLRRSMEEVLTRHLVTLNATFRLQGTQESSRDYWLWSFVTVAEADERREGLQHVAVSSRGAVVEGLAERLLVEAPGWRELGAVVGRGGPTAEELRRLYAAAAQAALAELEARMEAFRRGVHRRLRRDAARIDAYFGDLHKEMNAEIRRRRLTGEARELRREKQAQFQREAESKQAALRDKYRIRLRVQPFALLLARIPVLRCDLLVRRRKQELRLEVDCNGLTGHLDPLACQACGAPTLELGFCDEALHLLCVRCLDESDGRGRRNCPRCLGRRPPASPEAVTLRRAGGGTAQRSAL
ncbi:MAG: hypothetical protein ABI333_13790 [bacterium]